MASVEDELDRLPLKRRRRMLRSARASSSSPLSAPADMALKRSGLGSFQDWPGLPRGVKFDPTDEELMWHLLAKIGKGDVEPHPFIHVFIIPLDETCSIGYTHPQELPGVKHDGSASYFFHRRFKAYNSSEKHLKMKNDDIEGVCWQQVGRTEPVFVDRFHQGFKKILVLYMSVLNGGKLEKTNWVMHQYHLGTGDTEEGETVVSKIFYQQVSEKSDKNSQDLLLETLGDVTGVGPVKKPVKKGGVVLCGENHQSDLIPALSSAQVAAAHQSIDEENNAHVVLGKVDNYDDHQTRHIERVKIDPQFIVDSGQLVKRRTSVTLPQKQNYFECCEMDKCTSCRSSDAQKSDEVLKIELKGFCEVTQDVSPSLSIDIEKVDGCTASRSQDENYSADSLIALEECCTDGTVNGVVKSLNASTFHSPENVLIGTPFTVGQSLPSAISAVSCQNNVFRQCKCSQPNQEESVARDEKESIARDENLNASSQPLVTAFLAALKEVETEPMEEGYIKNSTEATAAMCSNTDMLCSLDKFLSASMCFSKGKICLDNLSSIISKLEKNEGAICKYSCKAFVSESHLSHTGRSLIYSNGDNQHLDSIASTCPVEVKSEPLEESYTNSCEGIAEPSQSCSLSDFPSESTCIVAQCMREANVLCSGSNLQEVQDTLCFVQASFPQEVCPNTTDKLSESALLNLPTKVMVESTDDCLHNTCKHPPSSFPDFGKSGPDVKRELHHGLYTDEIDDVPLVERMKMPVPYSDNNLHSGDDLKYSQQDSLSTAELGFVTAKTSHFSLRRKRKMTATDSVETALEEDAPGLLQVLLDKGITVDEIKLYGDMEDDDPMEMSPTEDDFEELEIVISKLFPERPSLFKFSSLRSTKGLKATYCLACLISLIEQTRYLQFRESPVEWGWCRDLQSFIFVFESHNRIVLERPEYGYATYFFELLESVPIAWQIKRLVTAMKLSSCSRTALIENRSLLIGQDLTEGEAQILESYGWKPNTGLGTLLNYCDRVVHDKNERYSSDWRAKIGKILMAGHDGGRTVLSSIPKKVVEYRGGKSTETYQGPHRSLGYVGFQNPEIKLET